MEKNIRIGSRSYLLGSDDNYLNDMGENFEPHMVQLFQSLITSDDVVLDIGANIGLTAILFSTLAHKVVAFEPSPSTYKILCDNLARAGAGNVEAINLGLGKRAESLTITFAKNNRSGGYVSDKIKPEAGHHTEQIQIDTLDNYSIGRSTQASFLKIDVEGFEQNVIEGGREFIHNNNPTVIMEMNHFCLNVLQRVTIPDFLDYMRSVFPYLCAVDSDNVTIIDLHIPDKAYMVMYEHVVRHRFPNIVGTFDPQVKVKLDNITHTTKKILHAGSFETPPVVEPSGWLQTEVIPGSVHPNESFEISVLLKNRGQEAWYCYGTKPVLLSYHWQRHDGSYLVFDGARTELKSPVVQPGTIIKDRALVIAPSQKGSFKLILTLVQEGVCWFEHKGFEVAEKVVEIA
jgi:FkbM family methyltransferase